MISDELISAIAHFFDRGAGPSHDELSRAFKRCDLERANPTPVAPGESIGKAKRVREVLSYALDHDPDAGDRLVSILIGSIKAAGGFRLESENYAGAEPIEAARSAFRAEGYELGLDGTLHASVLENLEGVEVTEALYAYVRRAQRGSGDAALVVGTGKDLVEATARHVIVETTGGYPQSENFPGTLFLAFERLGMQPPGPSVLEQLDPDPMTALQQALWLLGVAANRLRNAEGTGHGRPYPAQLDQGDSRLAIQSMGLVSDLLLGKLK